MNERGNEIGGLRSGKEGKDREKEENKIGNRNDIRNDERKLMGEEIESEEKESMELIEKKKKEILIEDMEKEEEELIREGEKEEIKMNGLKKDERSLRSDGGEKGRIVEERKMIEELEIREKKLKIFGMEERGDSWKSEEMERKIKGDDKEEIRVED